LLTKFRSTHPLEFRPDDRTVTIHFKRFQAHNEKTSATALSRRKMACRKTARPYRAEVDFFNSMAMFNQSGENVSGSISAPPGSFFSFLRDSEPSLPTTRALSGHKTMVWLLSDFCPSFPQLVPFP
jgi:hypothetical protein